MFLPVQLSVFVDGEALLPPWRQNGFVGTHPMACTVLSECTVHLHLGGGGPCKMSKAAQEHGSALLRRIWALYRHYTGPSWSLLLPPPTFPPPKQSKLRAAVGHFTNLHLFRSEQERGRIWTSWLWGLSNLVVCHLLSQAWPVLS